LRETLVHRSVKSVTMINIYRELVELCREHLVSWHRGAFEDHRVRLLFEDGRKFIQNDDGFYDVVIVGAGSSSRMGGIDKVFAPLAGLPLQVYALLMLYMFEARGLRGPVVKTVNMTAMVDKLGAEFGERVYEVPVGFKNVAPKMMETNALLGGEESGGFAVRGHIP